MCCCRLNVQLVVGKKAKISLWRPEWCEDICGTQNCIIEMFEEGHKLLEMFRDGVLGDPVPELKFVGERKDEYGYDGYVWVFENDTFEEANRILADYERRSHLVTNKDELQFPIYVIHSDNVELIDGIIWLDDQVLDDKNMKGDTLGLRRLQSPMKSIYPLKYMIKDYEV